LERPTITGFVKGAIDFRARPLTFPASVPMLAGGELRVCLVCIGGDQPVPVLTDAFHAKSLAYEIATG
jgi:hypothetical protein